MVSGKAPHRSRGKSARGLGSPAPESTAAPPERITVEGYVRPAPKEIEGLIRADHDGEADSAPGGPAAEPLFSTEGLLSRKDSPRRRRVPLLALVAGMAGVAVLGSLAGGGSPAPTGGAAGGNSSSASQVAAAGSGAETIMGASTGPGATGSGTASGSPPPGSTPRWPSDAAPSPNPSSSGSPQPSGSASASPDTSPGATETPGPSPTPSATPTPAPTPPPTFTPPPTPPPTFTPPPTLTPTPMPRLAVSIEPGGTITVAHKETFTLLINTLPGAVCWLSEPTYGTLSLGTTRSVEWGGSPPSAPWWAKGIYTVRADCTLSGYSPGWATKTIEVI